MDLNLMLSSVPQLPPNATAHGMTLLALWRAPASWPMWMQSWLFGSQWAWWITLCAIAAALLWTARGGGSRRIQLAGLGILTLAGVWMLMALTMDTSAERLRWAHLEVAAATGKQDMETVIKYLHRDFRSPSIGIGTEQIAAQEIRQRLESYGIKENRITSMRSELLKNNRVAMTRFVVLTTTAFGPVKTTWELEWQDDAGSDWRISYAKLLMIGERSVGESEVVPR